MLQERNFFLIFIHFKQCVLYLYDYKTRLFYTDSETKLASFPFRCFLLQEVHLIFPRFLWVCTRLPPYEMALCECNRKTATSTFQFPFSITRRQERWAPGEENVFSELFKNDAVNQRQRHQVIYGWFRKAK